MITDDMVATWKVNYGLDTRGPAEAMKWWADAMDGKAPAGAVAALGLLLEERDALRKDAERYRFVRDADKSDGLIPDIALYAMESLDDYVDDAMAVGIASSDQLGRGIEPGYQAGKVLMTDVPDVMSSPPLPPSPAEVGDLILQTREHVKPNV